MSLEKCCDVFNLVAGHGCLITPIPKLKLLLLKVLLIETAKMLLINNHNLGFDLKLSLILPVFVV